MVFECDKSSCRLTDHAGQHAVKRARLDGQLGCRDSTEPYISNGRLNSGRLLNRW
jgi:hypothetical protein